MRSKDKHFALYLLHFKWLRWIIKIDENAPQKIIQTAKDDPKSFKIGAAGAQVLDFFDWGALASQNDPKGTLSSQPGFFWIPFGRHPGATQAFGQTWPPVRGGVWGRESLGSEKR